MRCFLVAYRWEVLLVIGMHAPLWGFWVLALQGPLVLYDLAYEFVLWSVAVLLPAPLMGVLCLRLRRRGYGWESLLLVAIPFWALKAGTAYALVHPSLLPDFDRWGEGLARGLIAWGVPAQLVTVILLAALYPMVRRLGQDYLRLAWRFLLAVEVVGVVVDSLLLTMRARGPAFTSDSGASDAMLLGALLAGPLAMFLLLPLIRQASRSSLAHTFFMLALAFSFPWGHLFEPSAAALPELNYRATAALNVTVRSLAVGMTILAAWLLFNFDAWGPPFRRRAVAALFGAHALRGALFPFLVIPGFVLASDATALRTIAAILIAWPAAFWAAYLVRIRQPDAEAEGP